MAHGLETPITPPAAAGIAQPALAVPLRSYYRHYVLALLTGIYAVNVIDRFVVSIVTEQLKSVFSASDTWIGLLSGFGFALVYATLGIPIAYVADRRNRRNIVAGSLALFSAATLACGLATRFSQLLIARLVVGIGEAGTSPPSHSMIIDLYGPKSRATAFGIFSMGPNIGMLTAFVFGGWITGEFGWRATFLTAGVPGIILTLLLLLTVKEPDRGRHDLGFSQDAAAPNAAGVFRFLSRRRSFVHLTIASALISFVGYGTTQWAAPFLIRAHGLDVKTVGTIVGLFLGIGGGAGALLGGLLGSHLGGTQPRYYMLAPMASSLIVLPFALGFYLLHSTPLAIACFALPSMTTTFFFANCLAAMQSLVQVRMRAMTSAIYLSVVTIIGLAFGPTTVGMLSDLYRRAWIDTSSVASEASLHYAGAQGLRWALVTCSVVSLWAAFHFYMASRRLIGDLVRVNEP
jgi:predicted MFS family arabinose efflux permease